MLIPNQLKNERFVKCNIDKRPVEKKWTNTANYSFDEISEMNVSTYGVLCGNNNLMVIDCDTKEVQEHLMQIEEIRNTFIVQTAGKRLYHFYFHVTNTDNPKGFRLNNQRGERALDFQGVGTQVIGPNNILPNGRKYEIVNTREISNIDYKFLYNLLLNLYPKSQLIQDEKRKENPLGFEYDDVCASIKKRVQIKDLLPTHNSNPCMCPLGHPSEGGKCFSYNDIVWKCFHCGKVGNIFQLYQEMHKCNFITAKRELCKMAGIDDNFKVKVLELYADSKTKHLASEMLVKEIIKLNNIYTVRTEKDNEMWIYKNGIYNPHGKTYIKEFCREILGPLYKTLFVNNVIDKIVADTYIEHQQLFINEDINKVPVLNGILHLNNRQLKPFSPKYKFFNKLPIHYDPLIQPDKTINFFKDILLDEKDLLVVQELFGFLLLRDYRFEKAWMFLGKGRNGKGKLISLMERFIGKQNSCNVSLQQLETDKFITNRLFGKLANLSGDLSKTGLKNTGLFKQLTGRDLLTADRKFKDPIEFRNHAKMIFATNELPYSYDDSDGFWDRWILIDFTFKFVDNPTSTHHKKIDTDIIQKITSDKEMIGLLNWALDGLDRLLKNKCFSVSTSTEQTKLKWKRKSSSFTAFLMDNIEKDYSEYITKEDLNTSYARYCDTHNLEPESPNSRTTKLSKMGAYKKRKMFNGKTQISIYMGIRFKNDKFEEVEFDEI